MTHHLPIAVLGAGAAGCATALALAHAGHDVTLVDRRGLLEGTSNGTPARLGLGFHYADRATALLLLEHTIDFVTRVPGCTLGDRPDAPAFLRHARYFIARDSLFSPEEIRSTHSALAERYAELWADHDGALPYGDPAAFVRELAPEEYAGDTAAERVVAGFDTREVLMDWPHVRRGLVAALAAEPRVRVVTGAEATGLELRSTGHAVVHLRDVDGAATDLDAALVVDCTWENIDRLTASAGLPVNDEAVNRLKALLELRLPESIAELPSTFFCIGPFAMFSNMGDGRGMVTYAPHTNVHAYPAGDGVADIMRALDGATPAGVQQELAQRILDGVSRFIPAMADAEPVGLRYGVVRTHGTATLDDRESDVHRRDYSGVRVEAPWLVTNAATKLIYFLRNADEVAARVAEVLPAPPGRVRTGDWAAVVAGETRR
ncbi:MULTISPECIES: FAD-dependent oxidoreductase [Curtobacterium]|uniref:FAD-dependent oxidoreductase n=1 Tax=Curtobacterium flaccumfaciens TaxID=2035 RepID=UPI003EE5F3F5